jgi:hypothetical protein
MSQPSSGGLDVGGGGDVECPFGASSIRFFEDLHGDLAERVPFTAVCSRRDGIVPWRA